MNNRNEAIRNGLLQYVGALIKETDREGAEAAHVALAQLSEVWLEASRSSDGKCYDTYRAKPILRAAAIIMQDYRNRIVKEFADKMVPPAVTQKLAQYNMAIESLNEVVKATEVSRDKQC